MKRSPKPPSGQFTLALYQEPGPHLDATRKQELLMVLADLLLEALGMELSESQVEREENDESEDHT
ncbi:MAG: hypothetical protein NTV46_06745 [Verrucomicrobia bacterium]|nr:hypothetical protein [Verrucomicrobiota bacterium]